MLIGNQSLHHTFSPTDKPTDQGNLVTRRASAALVTGALKGGYAGDEDDDAMMATDIDRRRADNGPWW